MRFASLPVILRVAIVGANHLFSLSGFAGEELVDVLSPGVVM